MSEMKATSGFDFYETLRYFLPGLLLVFLFGYIAFPEYGNKFGLSEKLMFGVLIGFIIHSFGMYKWIPGSTRIRKEYHKKVEKLLTGVDDVYIRWDMMLLIMNIDERQHFRKYFALGAFKLDMVFVTIVFLIYYVFSILVNLIGMAFTNILNVRSLAILFCLFVVIYVVRDDGLNDLRRAFNVALMTLLKYRENGELEKKLQLVKDNKGLFIIRERKFLHPMDAIISLVTYLPKRIYKKINMWRKHE
jgi:hypothetical protein